MDMTFDDPRIVAVVRTSAVTGQGIDQLKSALFAFTPERDQALSAAGIPLADYLVYRPRPVRRTPFRVLRSDRGFVVTGADLGAVPRSEIDAALAAAGARPGDEVVVGEEVLKLA
jgi:hypothetical protein